MNKRRDIAREAIMTAGDLVGKMFRKGEKGGIEIKGRNDFVTGVDRDSEKIIKDKLQSSLPDIPFLAEESGSRMTDSEYWIIDPLDGTTNFIHGYQSVGVSIALLREGEVELGMVLDPLRGELFEAVRGGGASCNGERISVSDVAGLEDALIGTGFPFRAHQHLDIYLAVFRDIFVRCAGMRRAGAAVLDLAHTAAGRLDGFWEMYLKPWDMAAGALILEEAGGQVTDFFGTGGYLSSGNIVAGPASVHRALLSVTEKKVPAESIADLCNDLIGR